MRYFFIILATCLAPVALSQQPVLDQTNTSRSSTVRVRTTREFAQTFTPSSSAFINHIEIEAARNAFFETFPVTLYFYNTSGGLPVGPALASQTFSDISAGLYTQLTFDLSASGIFLQRDILYAFSITCPGAFYGISVQASLDDPYPRGDLWLRTSPSSAWTQDTNPDETGFRSTDILFAEYALVPEPQAVWILAPGLAAVALWMYRKRSLYQRTKIALAEAHGPRRRGI